MFTLLILALGLAVDSFSVSISGGLVAKRLETGDAVRIAFSFGFFQAVMPLIGWLMGEKIHDLVSAVDHWIAFGLLFLIGFRMIYESIFRGECDDRRVDLLQLHILLVLSLATSIDALAAGLSLSFLGFQILLPSLIIGVITFLLSLFGIFVSRRYRRLPSRKIERIGGAILIMLGVKILIEHIH